MVINKNKLNKTISYYHDAVTQFKNLQISKYHDPRNWSLSKFSETYNQRTQKSLCENSLAILRMH